MKYRKTVFLFCIIVIVLGGCSTSKERDSEIREKELGGEVVRDIIKIEPSRSYEECIELQPGMVFDYSFKSSDFVNFNIHYHAEDSIRYPVNKKGVMKDRGMIDPSKHDYYTAEQEFYCLMWDNINAEKVKISYECILKNK